MIYFSIPKQKVLMKEKNYFPIVLGAIGLIANVMGIYSFINVSNSAEFTIGTYGIGLIIIIYSWFTFCWFIIRVGVGKQKNSTGKSETIDINHFPTVWSILGIGLFTLPIHAYLGLATLEQIPLMIISFMVISLFHAFIGLGIYLASLALLPYFYDDMDSLHEELRRLIKDYF